MTSHIRLARLCSAPTFPGCVFQTKGIQKVKEVANSVCIDQADCLKADCLKNGRWNCTPFFYILILLWSYHKHWLIFFARSIKATQTDWTNGHSPRICDASSRWHLKQTLPRRFLQRICSKTWQQSIKLVKSKVVVAQTAHARWVCIGYCKQRVRQACARFESFRPWLFLSTVSAHS